MTLQLQVQLLILVLVLVLVLVDYCNIGSLLDEQLDEFFASLLDLLWFGSFSSFIGSNRLNK